MGDKIKTMYIKRLTKEELIEEGKSYWSGIVNYCHKLTKDWPRKNVVLCFMLKGSGTDVIYKKKEAVEFFSYTTDKLKSIGVIATILDGYWHECKCWNLSVSVDAIKKIAKTFDN